jgi:hypothetical protein
MILYLRSCRKRKALLEKAQAKLFSPQMQALDSMIGDIIFYEIHSDNNGKQRAVNSRINGLENESIRYVEVDIYKKSTHAVERPIVQK